MVRILEEPGPGGGGVKFGVKQLSTTTEELLNSLSPGERKRFMACFL